MAEKVTTMRLKVDLQCEKCYKKVKKVLCKFPQIQEQVFDEKQNIVIIKVVCCNPEKLRDELCCKGCGAIKSIEIVEPPPEPTPAPPPKPTPVCCLPCYVYPCPGIPPPAWGVCCVQCSEGRPGGPCFEGYSGRPPCYQWYCYGRPVYDSYGGGGRPCYVSRCCDQYFSGDNPTGCTIM